MLAVMSKSSKAFQAVWDFVFQEAWNVNGWNVPWDEEYQWHAYTNGGDNFSSLLVY